MKETIQIIAAMLCAVSISACDGYSPRKVADAAYKDHAESDVAQIPGSQYEFIVRNNNCSVVYVAYMGNDTKITSSVTLFKAKSE